MASGNLQDILKDPARVRVWEAIMSASGVSCHLRIALACVLLVSAGLLLRSFSKVLEVDLAFQPDQRHR